VNLKPKSVLIEGNSDLVVDNSTPIIHDSDLTIDLGNVPKDVEQGGVSNFL
jgi:hypothetical protein